MVRFAIELAQLAKELAVDVTADFGLSVVQYIRKHIRFRSRLFIFGVGIAVGVLVVFGAEVLAHATAMLALEQVIHHLILGAVWEAEQD